MLPYPCVTSTTPFWPPPPNRKGMLTPDVSTALITFASPDNAAPVFTQGILTREVCWEALRGEVPEGTDEAAAQEISRLLTTYANVASVHAFALEEDPSYVSPYDDPATSPPVVHVYSSDDMYIPVRPIGRSMKRQR